jgi:hypothetical protein
VFKLIGRPLAADGELAIARTKAVVVVNTVSRRRRAAEPRRAILTSLATKVLLNDVTIEMPTVDDEVGVSGALRERRCVFRNRLPGPVARNVKHSYTVRLQRPVKPACVRL